MAYGDTWVCRSCGAVFVEDDAMWAETDACPKCGARVSDEPPWAGTKEEDTDL